LTVGIDAVGISIMTRLGTEGFLRQSSRISWGSLLRERVIEMEETDLQMILARSSCL
jgi:hypothetical protein